MKGDNIFKSFIYIYLYYKYINYRCIKYNIYEIYIYIYRERQIHIYYSFSEQCMSLSQKK